MTFEVNRQAGDERIVAGYERADIRSIWQVQSRGYRGLMNVEQLID